MALTKLYDIDENLVSVPKTSEGELMSSLHSALCKCDADTMQHCLRVGERSALIMEEYVKRYSPELSYGIDVIRWAGTLHDVGKSKVPLKIIMKPTRLDPEERETIRKHAEFGEKILNKLSKGFEKEMITTAKEVIRYHHERYDGNGYPDGLAGDEIPLSAQIVGIADCFDALVSARSYKPAFSFDKAYKMIKSGECGSFSVKILSCLYVLMPE